jgi:glycine/D-amino acid oxidase-like deaminating enzyme
VAVVVGAAFGVGANGSVVMIGAVDVDVLVIGAGPAGSALAHQLATAGRSVVLADRAVFPRHLLPGGAHALATALVHATANPAAADAALRGYAAARAREVGPRLFASRRLQRAIRRLWLVRSFLRALGRWPALGDLVVTLTGDTVHPRELWRPSFWRAFAEAS